MGSIYLGTQRVLRVQCLIILKKVLLISIFERSFANEYSLFSFFFFFEHFQDHKLMIPRDCFDSGRDRNIKKMTCDFYRFVTKFIDGFMDELL